MTSIASDPARRRLVVAGAALLAGCATRPLIAPPAAEPAPPRVGLGDRWRYAVVNRFNGSRLAESTAEVVALTPELRLRVTDSSGRQVPDETYAGPWRVVQEPAYDRAQVFDDPVPLVPGRLVVGARERTTTAYRVQGSDELHSWSDWLDAVGWERVQVPAGEFDALRVERSIVFTHADRWRHSSQRNETLWYAPAVNRWVMREWTGRYLRQGMRRSPLNEDWIAWQLIEYAPARTAIGTLRR